jgi:PmbA protein
VTAVSGPGGPGGPEQLLVVARELVEMARPGEQVEVVLSRGSSTTIRVHDAEVESLSSADSSGAGVRVVADGRLGFAHCGSLDREVLLDTLSEARDNCAFGEPDPHNGIAAPDGVDVVRRDAWSDAVLDVPIDRKIELALDLERRALGLDPRVTSARTTIYGDSWGESVIATSTGIEGYDRGSSCSASTAPLANDESGTQIGSSHDAGRDPELLDLAKVAAEAVERATRLLGAGKPPSARMTILLEPRLAMTLLGVVSAMVAGDAVLKGRSAFAGRVGEQVASPRLTLVDDPTSEESLGSEEFDGEGLACRPNPLVEAGVLKGFLYDSTTARRAGVESTASAVRGARSLPSIGAQLLVMTPGERQFDELVESIDHGLYVNSFAGLHSGVNTVSGDFSVGADGLVIRGGQLAEPVRELTIASTLQRLLLDIVEVGGDFEWLSSGHGASSLVIGDVSVSGS